MKKWLAALLFGVSTAVSAVPPCFPVTTPPTFIIATDAVKRPPELGEVVYTASPIGLVWGYTCKDDKGLWWKVMAWGTWDIIPKDWLYIMDVAIRGTDADRKALWNKYAVVATMDERLLGDWIAVQALLPNPPMASEWKVLADPFRADKKRVVFNAANNRRTTPTTQFVDAGAPCNPATTIVEYGGITFMSVLGNPNFVARCSK